MNLLDMNLRSKRLRFALSFKRPPRPARDPAVEPPESVANDNDAVWPLVPFPTDWTASN